MAKVFLEIIAVLIMTLSGSLGAFFLKKGVNNLEKLSIPAMICEKYMYFGGFFYVLGALLNIVLLRFLPYTIVYPMTSVTYVWTLIVSAMFLKEKITWNKIAAVACIVIGVVFIAFS
ncbi:MAG: EamA family transporter [Acetatifactor sp.]|nr:EamA family transporter [Acetatifactor sp.]